MKANAKVHAFNLTNGVFNCINMTICGQLVAEKQLKTTIWPSEVECNSCKIKIEITLAKRK